MQNDRNPFTRTIDKLQNFFCYYSMCTHTLAGNNTNYLYLSGKLRIVGVGNSWYIGDKVKHTI